MLWKFNRFLPEKPCQTGIFAKTLLLMLIDVALLATIGIIQPRAPSAVQGVVPRLPRLVSIYVSRCASGFVHDGLLGSGEMGDNRLGQTHRSFGYVTPPGRSSNINSVM
jgi:hypothetical protein